MTTNKATQKRPTATTLKRELKQLRLQIDEQKLFADSPLSDGSEAKIITAAEQRITEIADELNFKSRKITLVCTPSEHEKLTNRAAKSDLSLNRFLVRSGIRDHPPMSADDIEHFKNLRFELRKIGINLNQSARAINAFRLRTSSEPNRQTIEKIISEVENLIGTINKKLS